LTPIRPVPRSGHTAGRSRRWVPRVAALALVLVALTGCTNDTFTRLGLPNPITKQGLVTLHLWQGSWIAGLAVAVVVWGLILWAVIFHRKRSDRLPPQVRYNLPIEILYTALPFVLIAVLFYYTAKDENYIDNLPPNPAVTVNVVGFQWSWDFNYPKYNVTDLGQMWNPNSATQDLPLLELPTNETVQFNLTSPDVIHSFWVPEFLFKRDVIPGHPNHFAVTLTKTGTFIGHCSELCGLYHSRMLFTLKVVTPAQFKQWIASRQAASKTSTTSVSSGQATAETPVLSGQTTATKTVSRSGAQ
jgi:cytochrome c oxidase subunit II